ncbi:MAG: NAD kinase [Cyclobacteriaceae bacterium]
MKLAIHGRGFSEKTAPYIKEVLQFLKERESIVMLSDQFVNQNKDAGIDLSGYRTFDKSQDGLDAQAIISLGGDGTLLETLLYVNDQEIPIMGINTGRLGFLATIAKQDINEALECLYSQNYKLEERVLIHMDSNTELFEGYNFALNEFAIIKKDTSSMINVKCYIDDQFLNSYWADGLIVSTPTGSTGYSLSCGGPIMFPNQENFIITPISPHNLNVRPLIVSANSRISFQIESRNRNFLVSLDSRSVTVDNTVNLSLKKEKFKAKLINLANYSFPDTLRKKLNWGLDLRN